MALHGALLAVALFGDKVPDFSREEQAIPVEIVHEIPKPPETPRLYWPEPPKDFAKPEVKPEQKAEPPKPDQPKETPKEQPKEQPKQETPKEAPKLAEPAKAEPPKPAPQKPATEKPAPDKAEPLKQADAPPQEAPKQAPAPQPAAPGNAPADTPAQAGAVGGVNARGNGQTPEALRAAYLEPPRPPLTSKDEVYLPLKSDLVPQVFRDRALTTDGQREVDDYKAQVFGLLEAAKPPPGESHAGQVIVGFTIDLEGKLLSASVVRSTGDAALDAQALETVRRAAPFPLPPPQSPRVFAAAIIFSAD